MYQRLPACSGERLEHVGGLVNVLKLLSCLSHSAILPASYDTAGPVGNDLVPDVPGADAAPGAAPPRSRQTPRCPCRGDGAVLRDHRGPARAHLTCQRPPSFHEPSPPALGGVGRRDAQRNSTWSASVLRETKRHKGRSSDIGRGSCCRRRTGARSVISQPSARPLYGFGTWS